MADKSAKEIIEESREREWAAERRILKHIGVSKHDRYAGEFPYPDDTGAPRLMEAFAFGDKAARDAFANAFNNAIRKNGWTDITVEKEDRDETHKPWPYGLDITVAGPGVQSTTDAFIKMANYFTAVAETLPQRPGTPWEEYLKQYKTGDEMVWKGGADAQIAKVNAMLELYPNIEVYVVGTHRSKSIELPVVQIEFPRRGTLLTFRDNFHDICVSVDSRFPIEKHNMDRLFATDKKDGFFEGFPPDLQHQPYDKNQQQFSFVIGDYPSLAMIIGELHHQDWLGPEGARPDPSGKANIKLLPPIRFGR